MMPGMPSPIGHALGGIAVGALVARRSGWGLLAACAVAGALPDIDFLLPMRHRGTSHSLGAAVLVGLVASVLSRRTAYSPALTGLAVGLAYASHALLDWLGADSSTPRGLMALWPVSSGYYISGLDVFNSVDRRYWLQGFWTRNTVTVLRELALLGPLAALSMYRSLGRFSGRGAPPPPSV